MTVDPTPATTTDESTSGPTDAAPTVSSTNPTSGASSHPTNGNVSVTFSEAVTLAAGWHTLVCTASGTMLSLTIAGGKAEAFKFLNALELVLISNNLGDSKSLATHPATTTHQRLTPELKQQQGITPGLIRHPHRSPRSRPRAACARRARRSPMRAR